MLFQIPDVLLSITAITNIGLLWFIYQRDQSNPNNRLFSLFVLFISFWSIIILLYRLVDSDSASLYLMKLSYIAALLLAYFFYQFSLLFPKPVPTSRLHRVLLRAVIVAVDVFFLVPGVLTLKVVPHEWGKEVILEPAAYWIFVATFFLLFLVGILRLAFKIRYFDGLERMQLKIISVTVLIVGAFGIYYNLILPSPMYQDFRYIWSGPVFTFLFAIVITYSIFRFKIFNPRAILAELLVYVLLLFLFLRMLFTETLRETLISGGLLVSVAAVGALLIKGVTREVEQRELIEEQEKKLLAANEGQTNLIHIMNHQVKGYLSKSRNIFAEMLSGDYGPVSDEAKPLITEGLRSLSEGVDFVQSVLNGSSAESGMLTYNMLAMDFKQTVEEASNDKKDFAIDRGLTFDLSIDDGQYNMVGDHVQLKEAVRNLVDNSIHYTPKGGITIHLARKDGKALLSVKDTGVGVTKEDMPRLFTKGGRGKDSLKINVNSTGYGLAFVKAVVEAHKGRVWVESEGQDKGSTFFIELPLA